jgi:hypothetical protein
MPPEIAFGQSKPFKQNDHCRTGVAPRATTPAEPES